MGILSAVNFWYFNAILAWALYYMVSSFQSVVPWSRCDQWWNTPRCVDFSAATNATSPPNASSVSSENGTTSWGNYTSPAWSTRFFDVNVTDGIFFIDFF